MVDLQSLILFHSTRNEDNAGTTDKIRLFLNGSQVVQFEQSVAPKGKIDTVFQVLPGITVEDIQSQNVEIGLTGTNAWAPKFVFMYGIRADGGGQIPIAQNFNELPVNYWVSQDLNDFPGKTTDRWPLTNISQSGNNISTFVLVIHTKDEKYAATGGPLEFSVFGQANGIPALVYQTILSPVGLQKPAEKGGKYLAVLPINFGSDTTINASQITGWQIANKSDDAWAPSWVSLYGLNSVMTEGIYLGWAWTPNWVSQDPHDGSQTTERARQIIYSNVNIP